MAINLKETFTFEKKFPKMVLDRTIAPPVHDAIEFEYDLPPINEACLDNGLPLYWLNAGVQDVVQVNWVFKAGVWYEDKDALAHAVAALLKSGTKKYTSAQINEALEFYGAQLKASAGNDHATVTLYALTKHLPALLPMVYELLTGAVFPEEEIMIYKHNAIQQLMVNLRKCEFVANQKIDATLFGSSHPYGRFSKKESIEALQREDLMDFYRKYLSLSGMRMFMAGRVGLEQVSTVNEIFGKVSINSFDKTIKEFQIASGTERKLHLTNDPNGVQGAIRIGRLFPNRHHPDYTPMVVLNTLFGGYFGSRLMSNIREDKGYTYGIYSVVTPEVNGGVLIIQSETGKDVIDSAIKEIYHEMDVLCNAPASDEELLLVKNYLLGNILGDLDGPFSILQRWRTLILNGFDASHFYNNVRTYKTITPSELQLLAQKYFRPEDFYEVVVV